MINDEQLPKPDDEGTTGQHDRSEFPPEVEELPGTAAEPALDPALQTMPASAATAQPVAPTERIAAVDVLRGVALLGILILNIVVFAWPFAGSENPNFSGGNEPPNQIAWMINTMFFQGKMLTLFSMLFGAGLILMSDRAKERCASIRGVYFRRLFWLFIIGMVHAYFIWNGDILVYYALCGVVIYLFRRVWPSIQIGLGTALVLFGVAIVFASFFGAAMMDRQVVRIEDKQKSGETLEKWESEFQKGWQEGARAFFDPSNEQLAKEEKLYRSGYATILRHRASEVWLFQIMIFLFFMLWGGAGRMLIGMGLMKLGVFSAQRSWRFYILLAIFGFGIGLPLTGFGVFDISQHEYQMHRAFLGQTAVYLGMVPVALGHAAVVMIICKSGVFSWLTYPFAAVGRMALTNYLMQSIICTFLFYGYGFGLFGYVDRVGLWAIVLAIWIVQLAYSPIWLKFFRYGPAEWLWRTLTYWKLQPMRNVG